MRRLLLFFFVLTLMSSALFSEPESLLTITSVPYAIFPVGSSTDIFTTGLGMEISASYLPASFRNFGFRFGSNFTLLPLETSDSIWVLSGNLGPVFIQPLGKKFVLSVHAGVGYYYFNTIGWDASGGTGGNFLIDGGAQGSLKLTNSLALGLGVSYHYYSKLYNSISLNLAVEWKQKFAKQQLFDERGEGLELLDIKLAPLFPVLYKYYDTHPVGTTLLRNYEKREAEDISIQLFVDRYMDNPMEIGGISNLASGEERVIDLFSLFTEDMMEITEGTKASAKISLFYTMGGKSYTVDYTPVLEFHNRNALMWDDDRKIASFVTAKDPEILSFSKNVMTWVQETVNPAVDENLQKGMAIFEAIKSYGIRYEVDPATPFTEFSEQKTAIDFLQFPRQTLQYTNGDCDDLTSLYTSLLEAVGVETAVITIPGHIYGAFALKSSPEVARQTFSQPEEFIIIGNKVWVPVEITMVQESFEKAWQTGAREWRENDSKDQSMLFPTRTSWQIYQAVGFREGSPIQLPDRAEVSAEFVKNINGFVEREIYPQESRIKAQMDQSNDENKYVNKLAVLYARYGFYDRALPLLMEIVQNYEYKPALMNLGNIFFVRQDFESARAYYQRVLDIDANNKIAILGISRCSHELEDYNMSGRTYQKLKTIDPNLAGRFTYLDLRDEEATRAADATGMKNIVVWEDEE
jgi:hypothetical protein